MATGGPRYRKFGSLVRYGENELENWMNAQPCGGDPGISGPDSTKTGIEQRDLTTDVKFKRISYAKD
jgi:hypothetical protein